MSCKSFFHLLVSEVYDYIKTYNRKVEEVNDKHVREILRDDFCRYSRNIARYDEKNKRKTHSLCGA